MGSSAEGVILHGQGVEPGIGPGGGQFMGEPLWIDAGDEFSDSGMGPGFMAVDLQDMGIGLGIALKVIRMKALRHLTGAGEDVVPGQGLVKVDAANGGDQIRLVIQHPVQIGKGIRFTVQGGIGVHQMTGIQQQAFVGVADPVQQIPGQFGIGERKTGPPLIFH